MHRQEKCLFFKIGQWKFYILLYSYGSLLLCLLLPLFTVSVLPQPHYHSTSILFLFPTPYWMPFWIHSFMLIKIYAVDEANVRQNNLENISPDNIHAAKHCLNWITLRPSIWYLSETVKRSYTFSSPIEI